MYLNQLSNYLLYCWHRKFCRSSLFVIHFVYIQLWRHLCAPSPFRSCPCHHSRLKVALYHHLMPHSPVKRSLACVPTCPVVRNHRLLCRRPAREPWLHLQPHPRFPSTGTRAGPQTWRAVLKEMRPCSDSASYPTTPPSGMWRKFMTSSDHCQVRWGDTLICYYIWQSVIHCRVTNKLDSKWRIDAPSCW